MASKRKLVKQRVQNRPDAGRTFDRRKSCLLQGVKAGGGILRGYFGRVIHPRQKEAACSVVCDADLASEKRILGIIHSQFPDDNIIAEESGRIWRDSEYTWVIDPLDGTSNFVAGIPWFGVQVALLRGAEPVLGAMYLPIEDTLYIAQAGKGACRNGKPVRVTAETDPQKVLCAFGFDPPPRRRVRQSIELLFRVAGAVRNTRSTNSLVDFCYTIDGRFGACINLKTMIWDIAPVALILPEAGGKFTHLDGSPIVFKLDEDAVNREYAILGASVQLHTKLVRLASGFPS